jgi:hypothetical protein
MELHFGRRGTFSAVAPLTFRVATFMLALFAGFIFCWRCAAISLGMGLSWCARWWFMVPLLRVRVPWWDLRFFRRGRPWVVWGVGLEREGIALIHCLWAKVWREVSRKLRMRQEVTVDWGVVSWLVFLLIVSCHVLLLTMFYGFYIQ